MSLAKNILRLSLGVCTTLFLIEIVKHGFRFSTSSRSTYSSPFSSAKCALSQAKSSNGSSFSLQFRDASWMIAMSFSSDSLTSPTILTLTNLARRICSISLNSSTLKANSSRHILTTSLRSFQNKRRRNSSVVTLSNS